MTTLELCQQLSGSEHYLLSQIAKKKLRDKVFKLEISENLEESANSDQVQNRERW